MIHMRIDFRLVIQCTAISRKKNCYYSCILPLILIIHINHILRFTNKYMFSLKKNYCTILRGGGGTFEVEYQNTQLVHDEKDEITSKFTTRRRG
jgi:hypothetical protein